MSGVVAARGPVAGICPVLETPFTETGLVDFDGFVRLIDHVVTAGVRSVMFPGFASEFYKMRESERDVLTRVLLERTGDIPGFVTVISVPDHATELAVERALCAVDLGADAINVLPPYQLGPSVDAVRKHVAAVAAAIAPTPLIVQYAPAQTGTALDAGSLSRLAAEQSNILQVKVESTPPGRLISALARENPALESIVGHAGVQMIDALRRGAVGVQPGSSFVELYLRVWDLWVSGDEEGAQRLHGKLLPYISYWMQDVELIIAAEKRISMLRGIIESDHCRAPMRMLDTIEQRDIDRFLHEFQVELLEMAN